MLPKKPTAQKKNLDDFIGGAKAEQPAPTPAPAPEPVKQEKKKRQKAEDHDDWERQTFIIRKSYHQKLKDLAYKDRITLKVALDKALEAFLITK